jgi:uncharacterized protein (DUF433 family)
MAWQDRITIDPEIMGGKPVVKGTRVPVQVVVGSLAGGSTIEQVCEGYSVTEEDVRAALAYAAEVLGQERLYALPSR